MVRQYKYFYPFAYWFTISQGGSIIYDSGISTVESYNLYAIHQPLLAGDVIDFEADFLNLNGIRKNCRIYKGFYYDRWQLDNSAIVYNRPLSTSDCSLSNFTITESGIYMFRMLYNMDSAVNNDPATTNSEFHRTSFVNFKLVINTCDHDGIAEGREECDTGSNTDGCINCRLQAGYNCSSDSFPQTCFEVCGNGIRTAN